MKQQLTVANLVMGAGGLVTFLFSFLAFFKYGPVTMSAWDGDGLAFATTVPAILGLAMVVWIVLELLGVSLPKEVLTFSPSQLKATWGIAAAGLMLSWISVDFGPGTGGGKGIGFWMMLLGSLAMGVGAVMALLGKGTETVDIPGLADTQPSAPGGQQPPPPPGGAPMAPPPPPPPA